MDLGVSEDFYTEIGRAAVRQSQIEALLGTVITNVAGVDEATGDAIVKPLSFRALADVATSLLKLKRDLREHGDAAADLLKRAEKAEQKRNQLVHSMWAYGPDFDPARATRVKLSGSPPELKAEVVSIDELRALNAEMAEIVSGLTYIHPFLRVNDRPRSA